MGSDIKQSLAAAEKLLKAGKVAEAIASFDRVVDKSNGDLLTVNRVGDGTLRLIIKCLGRNFRIRICLGTVTVCFGY